MDWVKTTATREEEHLGLGIWCVFYQRFGGRWNWPGLIKRKQDELLTLCIIHRVYCVTFSTFVDNELSKSPSNVFIMTNIGISVLHISTMITEPAILAPNSRNATPVIIVSSLGSHIFNWYYQNKLMSLHEGNRLKTGVCLIQALLN